LDTRDTTLPSSAVENSKMEASMGAPEPAGKPGRLAVKGYWFRKGAVNVRSCHEMRNPYFTAGNRRHPKNWAHQKACRSKKKPPKFSTGEGDSRGCGSEHNVDGSNFRKKGGKKASKKTLGGSHGGWGKTPHVG